ncbi:hypothetical protein Hdeb2414_s0007g00252601 [Helianthus debilis subsp. tardiflorus]
MEMPLVRTSRVALAKLDAFPAASMVIIITNKLQTMHNFASLYLEP